MKQIVLILLTLLFLSIMSCKKNHYNISGRVVNICNQPVPGIPIVFAGCTTPGIGPFSNSNSAFEYSAVTDANGEFSFKKNKTCGNAYLTINGSSTGITSDDMHVDYVYKPNLKINLHYAINAGDSITHISTLQNPQMYTSEISDTLFCISGRLDYPNYKIQTEFHRN